MLNDDKKKELMANKLENSNLKINKCKSEILKEMVTLSIKASCRNIRLRRPTSSLRRSGTHLKRL